MYESAPQRGLPGESAQAGLMARQVRILLDELFPAASDFDAFCFDYFPKVYAQFADAAPRTTRTTLLLNQVGHHAVADVWHKHFLSELEKALARAKQGPNADIFAHLSIPLYSASATDAIAWSKKSNVINRLPTLEIRFRQSGPRWEYQKKIENQREDSWQPLDLPSRNEHMLRALFDPESNISDAEAMKQPWRLRLRSADKFFQSPIPNIKHFANLQLPSSGMHLLHCGWTLCEMIGPPKEAICKSLIAVIGQPEFFDKINRLCRPFTKLVSPDSIPAKSLLVIERSRDAADATALHEAAQKAGCPLIIWGSGSPPTRSPLVAELITMDSTKEDPFSFMARFLVRLLAGYDPEQAFANCMLSAPVEDIAARWLRGAFDSWSVDVNIHGLRVDPRWYMHINRSHQENAVNLEIKRIYRKKNVNALVVLSYGPSSAGLDYFIRRKPALARSGSPGQEGAILDELDLTWTDDPGNQWQRLQQVLRSKKALDIPGDLVRRARSLREERQSGKAQPQVVLFVLRHELASFKPSIDYRQISPSALQSYILQLNSIASGLVEQGVKLLIHIPVINASEADFAGLSNHEYCHYVVLSPLSDQIEDSELRNFLTQAKVKYDDIEVELSHMRGKTYDELIQWLSQRFPELRVA